MISAPSNSSKTPVLEMTGVSVGSWNDPDTAIVEEVNWSVEAGEYWLLGGMHGSGKSDFLAMTDGLMYPLKGSYRLYGREMPGVGDELLAERLRVGLVFDGGQLFHHLTIEENIALPLRYHRALARGDLKNNVKTILDATGLSPWAGRLPGTMGRAWQKRAGLARALALRPEVLLLDNPLSGLDSRQQQWWLETLGQLSAGEGLAAGRPMTLVVTAQDLRPWRNRAAHVAILQKGRFHSLGRQTQLSGLTDPLVRELLSEQAAPV
jgi:ABC-type transporter Mla maintaining outer membrane lipid asymmetry ATPase subunit MlaF